MQTLEWPQDYPNLYSATRKVKEVMAGRGVFLAVDGQGEPGGEFFQQAIQLLYSTVYTLKFSLKMSGVLDFPISKLECLWLIDDPKAAPMSEWKWRMLIRIPEELTKEQIAEAKRAVKERNGLDVARVKRIAWKEGRALQMMHVGPYDKLGESYSALATKAAELGYRVKGPAHEIYISDPRRAAPEKLKTIVRFPA